MKEKKSNWTLVCLCITAICLSAPMNGLSPSLSMVAHDFGFDSKERDVYLGSYIALSTMLGQMIGSCISGYLADAYSRTLILVVSLLIGAVTTSLFSFPYAPYSLLVFLRIFTGACQAAVIPILFSLIGDYYKPEERATTSAIVSSCLGGGMMLGQLLVGYFLSIWGWRSPFLVMGTCSLLAALCLRVVLVDPQKGGNEEALAGLAEKGIQVTLPAMTAHSFMQSLLVPTVLLLLLQTPPNTVPWGVLSAHLHDLLATEARLSMQEATTLIALFGCGAAAGGLCGGFIGSRLYSLHKPLLPVFMGTSLAAASLLMQGLLSTDLGQPGALSLAYPVLVCAGALAAVNGANIRVLVINLTSPESRGASVALLGFVNCIGRGFGPLIAELYMDLLAMERRDAISSLLNLWLLSGALLCLAGRSLTQDEERLRLGLRRLADDALQAAAVGESTFSNSVSQKVSCTTPSSGAVNFRILQQQQLQTLQPPLFMSPERDRALNKILL
mmetsp:Transcript_28453/g.40521  ORF Transcript_28453/g.40521 Transcript_28453/m.40521 type:complete len:500 (+) Transcript_28453:18-1517(+)